jgi:hypothetical protein
MTSVLCILVLRTIKIELRLEDGLIPLSSLLAASLHDEDLSKADGSIR